MFLGGYKKQWYEMGCLEKGFGILLSPIYQLDTRTRVKYKN